MRRTTSDSGECQIEKRNNKCHSQQHHIMIECIRGREVKGIVVFILLTEDESTLKKFLSVSARCPFSGILQQPYWLVKRYPALRNRKIQHGISRDWQNAFAVPCQQSLN